MTCKIERLANGDSNVMLRVSGRVQVEHVGTIKVLIGEEWHGAILDLMEVLLVDRDVVTFLAACERKGVHLRNCPAFLLEWIAKEQLRSG
jgi:hypothetical protein